MTIDDLIQEGKRLKPTIFEVKNGYGNGVNPSIKLYKSHEENAYNSWLLKSKRYLEANHNNEESQTEFKSLSKSLYPVHHEKLVSILEAIKLFPTKKNTKSESETDGINININNSLHQQISISIVLEVLKNELTGSQYKEIYEIIKSNDEPVSTKLKVIEKLKSFGENTLSNIIAGLITNPAIWSQLM